ncbi:hypothetical protein [Streptacidiphilus sp. PAMC 29251]
MGTVGWLLVLPLAIGAYVGWQMYRYPGGWAYAFGAAYTAERKSLAKARRRVRGLERDDHRERSGAETKVRNAEARYRRRIRAIDRRLSTLRQPGRGILLEQLGDLVLHKHVLLVKGEVVPLAGLRVRFEEAKRNHHIYVTRPDGRVRFESFPHELHEEGEVRRFAVRIENEAAAEKTFLERCEDEMAEAEIALQQARADTSAQETARAQLAQVTERQQADSRIEIARSELEAEHERWQAVTGHRPH